MPDVEKLWQASHAMGLSFCNFLVRRVFGLTGLEYKQVQAQFGPNPSHSLVGIYQNGDAFAIVMDLSGYSKVSLAGAGLATAAALGTLAYGASQLPRKKKDATERKELESKLIETPRNKELETKTDPKAVETLRQKKIETRTGAPTTKDAEEDVTKREKGLGSVSVETLRPDMLEARTRTPKTKEVKDDTERKIETPHQKKTDGKEAHIYPDCPLCQMDRGSPSKDLKRMKGILFDVWTKFDQVGPINTTTSWSETQVDLNSMCKNIKAITSKSTDKGLAFAMYSQTAQAAISKMIEYPHHESPHVGELEWIRKNFDDFNRTGLAQNGEQQSIDTAYLKFLRMRKMFQEDFPTTCTHRMIAKDPVLHACKEVADQMKRGNECCRQLVEELQKEIEEQFTLLFQKSCSASHAKITSLFEKESQEWLKIISPSVLAPP